MSQVPDEGERCPKCGGSGMSMMVYCTACGGTGKTPAVNQAQSGPIQPKHEPAAPAGGDQPAAAPFTKASSLELLERAQLAEVELGRWEELFGTTDSEEARAHLAATEGALLKCDSMLSLLRYRQERTIEWGSPGLPTLQEVDQVIGMARQALKPRTPAPTSEPPTLAAADAKELDPHSKILAAAMELGWGIAIPHGTPESAIIGYSIGTDE